VQVMEITKRVLSEEHPSTLTSISNLAFTWKEQGRNVKAIDLMNKCIHLQIRILGANYFYTLSSATTFTEWQIQELRTSCSAANDLATIKEERG